MFWANLDSNGTADRLVLGLTDGNLLIAARRGDPTPIGGTFGSMDAWPAINGNIGTLNVGDAWRPKRRTQRAHGFQSLPKRYTYSDTDGNAEFHSYADREPDAKGDSDAKAQANAEAASCCAELKVSYSSLRNNNMNTRLKIALLVLSFIGAWGLTLTIKSGYAGSRLAANLSNTIAAGSSSRQWVWQNRLPQGNTLQDFSFIDTNNGFAVGARGTILKTTDGGNNWEIMQAERRTIFMAFLLLIQISEPL